MQHLHLALVQHIFVPRYLAVRQGFVHLIPGIEHGLYVAVELVLLVELGDLELRLLFPLCEDWLHQRGGCLEQHSSRVGKHTAVVRPSYDTLQREGRIELRAGRRGVIERFSQRLIGRLDVCAILQQRRRHTGTEALR